MSSARRSRVDPRSAITQAALIECAEDLFAQFGVEGVSLRQIAAAINSRNTNVVAYHFGSKEGLIEAIFRHHRPYLEQRRTELRAILEAGGTALGHLELLEIIFRPFLELVNRKGRHTYVAFLWSLHGTGNFKPRRAVDPQFPITSEIVRRLFAQLPPDLRTEADDRLLMATGMVASCLLRSDRLNETPAEAEQRFAIVLRMIAAAFLA